MVVTTGHAGLGAPRSLSRRRSGSGVNGGANVDDLRTTFYWIVIPAFIGLMVLERRLPKPPGGIISLYDAGMFSIYLVCLVWGAIKIVGGEITVGWIWVVTVAGLFGWRMYTVFNERK
jgi:hypothetical protein